MSHFDIVIQSNENTVVTEYTPEPIRSGAYESEAALENKFIDILREQCYEYLPIKCEADLIANIRTQLEKLNNYTFSDGEWSTFFNDCIVGNNEGIKEKTRRIQEDYIQILRRDNGETKNIYLIDKKNVHNNSVQVINQYVNNDGVHDNRYDVTILVNGLPLVHVELKRRGIPIREAFNQINRYQRDSFWAASGLYNYVQIFVISNGTHTKYYSNTTRYSHIKELNKAGKSFKTSHSFEFTSFWADASNKNIIDLVDFAKTFFSKRTLLNILTKYCVFTSEELLLVMRPYQIVATERIINRIEIATNHRKWGTIAGGGYVWHTTGSGKTLTSFKTAQLARRLDYIDKVLFVVDRKDLDYQTMKEYDRFEKGAANSNKSTAILQRQLESDDARSKIIITTIQKLSTFVAKNSKHPVYDKHVVLIFDECHRSQFGEMHKAITKCFKKYHIFGFTGTPIFPQNASGSLINAPTTEQTFGDQLHCYTIIDAIRDKNVLPFRVDYIKTMDKEYDIIDEQVKDIDREKAYMAPKRIALITDYIYEHFNQKTYRNERQYKFNALTNISDVASAGRKTVAEEKTSKHLSGFNSIFAVSSIEAARLYYEAFKKKNSEVDPASQLKFATIFSYGANEDVDGIIDEENPEDTGALDASSRDFLEKAIVDYNGMFHTNYDTSSDKFQNYYKDVSLRMKNKELDVLIVVNMFLTGFDATTLNTLWVDKNLKMHGLLQAFSRTNRILNSIKTFGNIVCFRNLQKRTEEALSLFGDKDACGIVLLRTFNDYYYGFTDDKGKYHPGYKELIEKLMASFPLSESEPISEEAQKEFMILFGNVLRFNNVLSSFDEFTPELKILSEREMQDYLGRYQDLHDEWKNRSEKGEKASIIDDIVYEIELVKQIEINIDYILALVQQYQATNRQDKEVLVKIKSAVFSSPELRSKKELIESFIDGMNDTTDVLVDWQAYVANKKEEQLEGLIREENLKPEETRKFIENAFQDGAVKTTGADIDAILPAMSRFGGGNRDEKKQRVIEKVMAFFERFFGIA